MSCQRVIFFSPFSTCFLSSWLQRQDMRLLNINLNIIVALTFWSWLPCVSVSKTSESQRGRSQQRDIWVRSSAGHRRGLYISCLHPSTPMTAWSLTKLMRDILGQRNLVKFLKYILHIWIRSFPLIALVV